MRVVNDGIGYAPDPVGHWALLVLQGKAQIKHGGEKRCLVKWSKSRALRLDFGVSMEPNAAKRG